jgi:hypothetical protein
MKYYVIMEADIPVGVVFCDPQTAFYSIRAVTESLQTAFEATATIVCSRFVRKEQGLTIVSYSAADPGWIDKVLETLCAGGHWLVGDTGDCLEGDMESLIIKYLAWSTKDSVQAMRQLQGLTGSG